MTIQINTDNNLSVHEAFGTKLQDLLLKELHRFSEHITRLEVYLSDENGQKKGFNDKKCVLEAHLEGRPTVAVKEWTGNHELSLHGAIDKLKTSLEKIIGKMKLH